MRGQMENAVVVLGSATPSLESFYNCKRGKFFAARIAGGVGQSKNAARRVVDMRQAAHKEKGTPLFSPQLKEAITQRLEKHEQTILFLKPARPLDFAAMPEVRLRLQLPELQPRAHVSPAGTKTCCHICGHVEKVPLVCPNEKCKNPAIRFSGTGTQKVEETLAKLFPGAHPAHGRRHDEAQRTITAKSSAIFVRAKLISSLARR